MNLVSCNKIFTKIILSLIIVVFLTFNLFGLINSMSSMSMDSNGLATMSDCFLMTQTSMCSMGFAEHMNLWQLMFNTLIPSISLASVFILALALFFTKILFNGNPFIQPLKFLTLRYKLYLKQHPLISLCGYLKEAFSRGIINPKIYALATI